MSAVASGQGKVAREHFVQSTDILATGLALHRQYAAQRAQNQQTAATVLVLGIGLIGAKASSDASAKAQSAAELNRINAAFSDFTNAAGNFGQFLNEQIRLGELNSSAVARVDRDRWRSVVVSNHKHAQSVVQIHNETRGTSCTAFFVDPYVLMTAAHCFKIGDALGAFRDSPQNGKNFMTGNRQYLEITHQFSHVGWDGNVNSTGAFDVAFLMMKNPSASWLPVSTASVRPGQELMALGYSGDLNDGYFLQIDYGCQATSIGRSFRLGSNCVIWRGNSGGPILTTGANPRVVGVNSSGHLRGDRSANDTFAASTRSAVEMFDLIINHPYTSGKIKHNPFR